MDLWHIRFSEAHTCILDISMDLCSFHEFTREKSFCKTCFQVGMELKKVQKQGRDEKTQEDYCLSCDELVY